MLNLQQIKFCAEECERQQSGEKSVYWMTCALEWMFTVAENKHDTFGDWMILSHPGIQELGRLIEPKKNANGYRKTPVMIGDQVLSADNIQRQIDNLIIDMEDAPNFSLSGFPVEFYKEFEEIHPFIDGNGRVGAILYNYLKGTLESPVAPPDVFKKEK